MSNYEYQCFDAPPTEDGWTPVGDCHATEEECNAACGPGGPCEKPCEGGQYAESVAKDFNPINPNRFSVGDIYTSLKVNGQYLLVSEIREQVNGNDVTLRQDPNKPIETIASFYIKLFNSFGSNDPDTASYGCSSSRAQFVSVLKEASDTLGGEELSDVVYISSPKTSAEPINYPSYTPDRAVCFRSITSSLKLDNAELNGGENIAGKLCLLEKSRFNNNPDGNIYADCGKRKLLSSSEINNSTTLTISYNYYKAEYTTEQQCQNRDNWLQIGSQTFSLQWSGMFDITDCTQCIQCFRTFDVGPPGGYYDCFPTNDGDNELPPPDFGYTWEKVGDCSQTFEECAKACQPNGGVCAYREEEEYCGPPDELPGVRGDWCRVVDVPDDKSCADKGAAFCCDAYSDDQKILRDQFSAYTVGNEVTGFSLSWPSVTGPFVITSISGSRYIAEAPTDDGVARLELEFVSPTNFIYGCRVYVEATFNLPITNSYGEQNFGLRFSYDSRQGILTAFPFDTSLENTAFSFGGKEFNFNFDIVLMKRYQKAKWKQNWTTFVAASTKDFKDNRNQFATISAVEWNANQSLQGQVNIAGYDSSGMPRDDELVPISFTWPDLFTRKISPPNPYWYCSGKNYLVAPYCPTDDLASGVVYYRTEEEVLLACTTAKTVEGGRTMPTTKTGPGTHLKNTLAAWGIHAKKGGGCKCKDMEVKMNRWGADCRKHMDAIVDHLQAEAKKRNMPFVRKAGKMLVERAIRRFEKES